MNSSHSERDEKLLKLLNMNPELRDCVEEMLQIAVDEDDTIETADDAEDRIVERGRELSKMMLGSWAEQRSRHTEAVMAADPELRRAGKKLWWRSTVGAIAVEERLFRKGSRLVRGFSEQAKLSCRGMSMRLQRAVTDFGAELPFAQVSLPIENVPKVPIESTPLLS